MQEKEPLKAFLDNYVFGQKSNSQKKAVSTIRPWLRYWPILAISCFAILTFVVYCVIKDNGSQTISQNYEESPGDLTTGDNDMIKMASADESIETAEYDDSLRSSKVIETPTKGLMVTGILYSEDSPSAVVGNQLVHEGDKISGAIIVKINPESVEFEKDKIRWTQAVKQPPASYWE